MKPDELCPGKRHYKCNCCGAANAGEMLNSKQIDFYGLLDLEKQLTMPLEHLPSES